MIGLILGTSEGRKILKLINKYTSEIAVTTATSYGGSLLRNFKVQVLNTKPLDKKEMTEWIRKNKINILVDASHPYAAEVTSNAMDITKKLNIPYVRYERLGVLESLTGDNIIKADGYDEVINIIKNIKGNIMNTTGGNNVEKFIDINFDYRIIHRILPSVPVLDKLIKRGVLVKDILALQGPIKCQLESAFIKQFQIKAIITKDSGIEGGALEKFKAAKENNIKIIVIRKPKFNYDTVFYDEESIAEYVKTYI